MGFNLPVLTSEKSNEHGSQRYSDYILGTVTNLVKSFFQMNLVRGRVITVNCSVTEVRCVPTWQVYWDLFSWIEFQAVEVKTGSWGQGLFLLEDAKEDDLIIGEPRVYRNTTATC